MWGRRGGETNRTIPCLNCSLIVFMAIVYTTFEQHAPHIGTHTHRYMYSFNISFFHKIRINVNNMGNMGVLQPKVMVGAPHQWLIVGPYALTGRVFLPRSRERNSQQDGWSTPGRDHFWGEWKNKSVVTLLTMVMSSSTQKKVQRDYRAT